MLAVLCLSAQSSLAYSLRRSGSAHAECICSLIKEFEQEARTDNMPAAELTSRKKGMVQQLNEYIAKKKELGSDIAGRKELIGAAKRGDAPKDYNSKLHQVCLR